MLAFFELILFAAVIIGVVAAGKASGRDKKDQPATRRVTMSCPSCGSTADVRGGHWECPYCGDSGSV